MLDSMMGVWFHDRPKVKPFRGQPVRHAQPKRDGHRATGFMQADDDNGLCVFGKLIESDLELSHHLDWHPTYKSLAEHLPPRSSVDMEIWVPGKPASYVKTAMINRDYMLRMEIFAIPYWVGQHVTTMMAAMRLCNDQLHLPFIDTREYSPDIDWLNAWPDSEGAVLKGSHYRDWFKLKKVQTADLFVTAVKPGKGRFEGMCGSLHGSVLRDGEEVEVACVSGMDDELRAGITEADIGRVFEVKYDYIGAGGRLRFPQFLRWREDKLKEQCTWSDQLD